MPVRTFTAVCAASALVACTEFDSTSADQTLIRHFGDAKTAQGGPADNPIREAVRSSVETSPGVLDTNLELILQDGQTRSGIADYYAFNGQLARVPLDNGEFGYAASPLTSVANAPGFAAAHAHPEREGSVMLAYDTKVEPVTTPMIAGATFNGGYLGHLFGNRIDGGEVDVTVSGDVTLTVNAAGTGIATGVFMTNRQAIDAAGNPQSIDGYVIGHSGDLWTTGGAIDANQGFHDLSVTRLINAPMIGNATAGSLSGAFVAANANRNPPVQMVGSLLIETETFETTSPLPGGSCDGAIAGASNGCTVEVGVIAARIAP